MCIVSEPGLKGVYICPWSLNHVFWMHIYTSVALKGLIATSIFYGLRPLGMGYVQSCCKQTSFMFITFEHNSFINPAN